MTINFAKQKNNVNMILVVGRSRQGKTFSTTSSPMLEHLLSYPSNFELESYSAHSIPLTSFYS